MIYYTIHTHKKSISERMISNLFPLPCVIRLRKLSKKCDTIDHEPHIPFMNRRYFKGLLYNSTNQYLKTISVWNEKKRIWNFIINLYRHRYSIII